jgi:hypothetical protein
MRASRDLVLPTLPLRYAQENMGHPVSKRKSVLRGETAGPSASSLRDFGLTISGYDLNR